MPTATRRKLQPTAVAGQPLVIPQPQMRVPEPVALVGMQTGQVHAITGDNPAGPETITVQPPAAAPMPAATGFSMMSGSPMPKPVSMAEGGTATVGAIPTFDNELYQRLRSAQRGNQWDQLRAEAGAISADQGVLPYSAGVLQARANTFPLRTMQINANRGVLAARGQSLAAQRGFIGQEQAANAAELADFNRLQAAKTNVADQNAVAQEALRRGVENADYAKLGVAAPVDVNTAPGQEGSVAPWARAKLKTQADIVGEQNDANATMRANQLRAAQLAVQLQDTNVTEAQNAASAAGLTLEEANALVDQAQNAEGFAQLQARGAGYDASAAGVRTRMTTQAITDLSAPTDQGFELYIDPQTGERRWVTPAEADNLKYQYELGLTRQRLPEAYQTELQRRQYTNQQQGYAAFQDDELARVLKADPSKWAQMQQDFIAAGMTPYQASVKVGQLLEASRRITGTGGGSFAYGSGGAGSTPPGGTAPATPATPPSGNGFTFTP